MASNPQILPVEYDPWATPEDASYSGFSKLAQGAYHAVVDPWRAPLDQPYQGAVLPFSSDGKGVQFNPQTGIVGSISSGLTLPGDVYAGRVDPNSPEGFARAQDLVGLLLDEPQARNRLQQETLLPKINQDTIPAETSVPKLTLAPTTHEEAGYYKPSVGIDDRVYNIVSSDEPDHTLGVLHTTLNGDTARINDIYSLHGGRESAKGIFGNKAMGGLLKQFLEENPQITKFTGERVSGARRGGGWGLAGTGQEVSVPLSPQRIVPVNHDPWSQTNVSNPSN